MTAVRLRGSVANSRTERICKNVCRREKAKLDPRILSDTWKRASRSHHCPKRELGAILDVALAGAVLRRIGWTTLAASHQEVEVAAFDIK
jgi:hypothetical protein